MVIFEVDFKWDVCFSVYIILYSGSVISFFFLFNWSICQENVLTPQNITIIYEVSNIHNKFLCLEYE